MISLGNNIDSLRVRRSLGSATNSLARNYERLSSGQRINHASDDAAGLAIADSLKTRARLYDTASRNINDGISALNIASSSLDQQIGILQRLSELAEQAANGTYSATQRASADTEYQALIREFGRTGDTASFNGISLLLAGRSGQTSAINLQTGVNGGSSDNLAVGTTNTGTLSGVLYASTLLGPGATELIGAEYTYAQLLASSQGQILKARFLDSSGTQRELLLTASYEASSGYILRAYAKCSDIGPIGYSYGGESTPIGSLNNYQTAGAIYLATDSNGRPTTSNVSVSFNFNQETTPGTLTLDISGLQFLRSSTPTGSQALSGDISNSTCIEFTGIDTAARALTALTTIQNRRNELLNLQGQFGAAQSRLESSLRVTGVSGENSRAAEARIRDADIADETANLTASQLKQQSAAQILAQANNQTALALQLLRL